MKKTILLCLVMLFTLDGFAQSDSLNFWPHTRRMDRKVKSGAVFGYKGELMLGLTASYGTISSEDSELYVYLDNINLDGALTTVKPFVGYFYRDNRCIGARLGYQYLNGDLGSLDLDLGPENDIEMNISGMQLVQHSYSVGVFHRAYYAIDPKGQFAVFAEIEGSAQFGTGEFTNNSGDEAKYTESRNMKFKLAFNPGMAVYIFPSVCASVSIGLGGLQYGAVKQFDENGERIGTRRASKMRFRLNVADINFGMTFHLWNKKGMAKKY